MQQEQLRSASVAGGIAPLGSDNFNLLRQCQEDPQQVLNIMLMSMGGGSTLPPHSSANPPFNSDILASPPRPPPPQPLPEAVVIRRRISSFSLDNDLMQNNILLNMGRVDQQQASGSLMSPSLPQQPPPPPPPPPPRPIKMSGGSSFPTSPSASSCNSLSGSIAASTVKAGPFFKGQLAILKKEQAVAEALAAAALQTAGSSSSGGLAGSRSHSPSVGGELDSGQRMSTSAAMGKVQMGTFHAGNTAVVDFSQRSLQPPPPPHPPPKPSPKKSDALLSPTRQSLQDGNYYKMTKIEDFLSMKPSTRPGDDDHRQLQPSKPPYIEREHKCICIHYHRAQNSKILHDVDNII